ncbi:hypothetical protein [Tabrizicola soli]|uniref:Restriction endonuclease n=1 Tax=Tabrizicola soli TaxID=2185115 RepID=A0ABV7E1K8_9RHOB|nr:hypothetical protein [Tabrizicola soli]
MTVIIPGLTPAQLHWVNSVVAKFQAPRTFWADPTSDIINADVLESLGNILLIHHAFSRQALSKDRFEFALEQSLLQCQIPAKLTKSRTNPGADIEIRGVPCSLKTEAAANISRTSVHISKYMELGKGPWLLPDLRDKFLHHLRSYERIFTFRHVGQLPGRMEYELLEIPKDLFLMAANARLIIQEGSRQTPKPGYGYVENGPQLLYALYFDGGSERKLQIKHLDRNLCRLHATWIF